MCAILRSSTPGPWPVTRLLILHRDYVHCTRLVCVIRLVALFELEDVLVHNAAILGTGELIRTEDPVVHVGIFVLQRSRHPKSTVSLASVLQDGFEECLQAPMEPSVEGMRVRPMTGQLPLCAPG